MSPKIKGVMFSVILIVIALLMIPLVVDGVHSAVTDRITEAYPGCVVGAGATDVVLTNDLYRGLEIDVIAITATGAGAVPAFNTWTDGTNTLNIDGLGADTPQDITVTYDYNGVAEFGGVETITGLMPLLVVIGIIIVAIFNGLWAFKRE